MLELGGYYDSSIQLQLTQWKLGTIRARYTAHSVQRQQDKTKSVELQHGPNTSQCNSNIIQSHLGTTVTRYKGNWVHNAVRRQLGTQLGGTQ